MMSLTGEGLTLDSYEKGLFYKLTIESELDFRGRSGPESDGLWPIINLASNHHLEAFDSNISPCMIPTTSFSKKECQ